MDKTIRIEIQGYDEGEDEALDKAVQLVWRHRASRATIFVHPRIPSDAEPYRNPGWLEYLVRMTYESGAELTVGMIQRRPGAEYEYHS